MDRGAVRSWAIAAFALTFVGCAGPAWPEDQFPAEVEVKRTLFAGGGGGFREACQAVVVEITAAAATRIVPPKKANDRVEPSPPRGWNTTPLRTRAGEPAYYKGAFGGCNAKGGSPAGDLPGALTRPGAYYKIINGGEGIAILAPRAKLAGFYYFG